VDAEDTRTQTAHTDVWASHMDEAYNSTAASGAELLHVLFHSEGDDHHHHRVVWVGWIFLPTFFAVVLYAMIVAAVWPCARPIFPLWLILVAVFFPFLIPFLLFYACFSLSLARRPLVVAREGRDPQHVRRGPARLAV
jgi:hypothetical protein